MVKENDRIEVTQVLFVFTITVLSLCIVNQLFERRNLKDTQAGHLWPKQAFLCTHSQDKCTELILWINFHVEYVY